MRVLGLKKRSFVCLIYTQALAFVIPSLISGYICACPALYLIEAYVFNVSKENIAFIPDFWATIEAIAVGLIIPMLSASIPTIKALSVDLIV